MQKYLCFFSLLICLSCTVNAQDTLVLRNGNSIQAKIIEIKPDVIIYKKYTYQDGPSITIDKNTISLIKYPDGSFDSVEFKPLHNNIAEVKENTPLVFFYRPSKMLSSARYSEIYINDSFVCKVGNGKIQTIELKPGTYTVKSTISPYSDSSELKVEMGKLYYFKCLVKGSLFKDKPELVPMDLRSGAEETGKMEKVYNLYNKPSKETPQKQGRKTKKLTN